ncbi:GIY-YIG nuclease family protein [Aquamicrobium defluvii]|uniref:Bacteriophage T5 Orf172 DNA-binding domain-containing protein n=1 Tax=Aquamicrobium defluvii TaxID=69279 RepID=A0A011TD56_9HYPH|nr:GIY-YIG nuclease family protein [Aquamicrobium defluvii]EXL09584.1 hypothetical protein BG36_20900 [Aquamicrobium defluvii]EZQ16383.1 hypothetical protein CF98_40825 [Halopseudomonas bauzanensis]
MARAARGRKPDEGVKALGTFEQEILSIYHRAIERYGEQGRLDMLQQTGLACGSKMCVYFVRMGSTPAHKIGLAYHADSRVKSIQTGSPLPVRLVAWINAPTRKALHNIEREAHAQASRYGIRARGEWFNLGDGAVRKVIDGVVATTPGDVLGVNYDL